MSKNQRKAFFMVLSVFVSVLLWLYVSVIEDPEGEGEVRNVQITFAGVDALAARNLSVISNEPPSLRLTFRGRRSDLNEIDNKNVSVVVDLSQITYAGTIRCPYTVVLPDNVKNSLFMIGNSSTYVNLFVDQIDTKFVDVRLVSNITAAEGFMVEQSVIDPREIRIKGPATVLSKIEYAEATLNRTDVDQSIDTTLNYLFKDAEGNIVDSTNITPDTPSVRVSVPILKTKKITLDVDIRDGGGITLLDNVNYKITPDSIVISGDAATLDTVNVLKLAQIDLSKVKADNSSLPFKIVLPNGCENLSGVDSATVEIEIVGAKRREVRVSNIETINENLPEGYMISLITKELPVTLRGPEGIVGFVNPINVRVVVDLADLQLQPGQILSPPAKVFVDGYNNRVGAVGDYSVPMEIVPIPEE